MMVSPGSYKNVNTENDADNFWIANENMLITPLVGILRDVRQFVKRSAQPNNNMWYYNPTTRQCVGMSYRGCYGNRNRYCTLQTCQVACVPRG